VSGTFGCSKSSHQIPCSQPKVPDTFRRTSFPRRRESSEAPRVLQPPRKGFVGAAVFESLDSRLRGNDGEATFRAAPLADILPRPHRHCSIALYVQVPAFLQRTQVDLFDGNRYIPRCEKG